MPGDWYYTQNNERRGPVSLAKLKSMAADGWLGPDDLVWHAEMESWVPARDAEGLFPNSLGRLFHKTIAGLRPRAQRGPNRSPADNTLPMIVTRACPVALWCWSLGTVPAFVRGMANLSKNVESGSTGFDYRISGRFPKALPTIGR